MSEGGQRGAEEGKGWVLTDLDLPDPTARSNDDQGWPARGRKGWGKRRHGPTDLTYGISNVPPRGRLKSPHKKERKGKPAEASTTRRGGGGGGEKAPSKTRLQILWGKKHVQASSKPK